MADRLADEVLARAARKFIANDCNVTASAVDFGCDRKTFRNYLVNRGCHKQAAGGNQHIMVLTPKDEAEAVDEMGILAAMQSHTSAARFLLRTGPVAIQGSRKPAFCWLARRRELIPLWAIPQSAPYC